MDNASAATDDFDVRAAEPSWKVKASAALHAMAGLFVALTGLQIIDLRFYEAALNAVPWALLAVGVSLIVLAALVYRTRPWAALAGIGVSGFAVLASGGWAVYAIGGGIFSLLGVLSVPVTILAFVAALFSLSDVRVSADVRQRLADEGMDLGF